jgi:hypothetical protein
VVAYFVQAGVQVKMRGLVESVTAADGLVLVVKELETPVSYLVVPLGSPVGAGCTFAYGDKRELPEQTREDLAEKLGDAVLIVNSPDGGQLRLFFSLGPE